MSRATGEPTTPSFLFMAARDFAVAVAAFALFFFADAFAVARGGVWLTVLAVLVALATGAALTTLAHEWGHLVAARFARARAPFVTPPPTPVLRFLFHYDFAQNNTQQFQWMSFGGNLAPWLLLAALVATLGLATPARLALAASVLGFSVFIALTEWPVMWRCARGAAPLAALAPVREVLRRNAVLGALTTTAMLATAVLH